VPLPTQAPTPTRTSSDFLRPDDQYALDWAQSNMDANRPEVAQHIYTGLAAKNKLLREQKEQQASESASFFMKHLVGFTQAAEATGQELDPKVEGWYRGLIYAALNDAGKPDEARQFLAGKTIVLPPQGVAGKISATGNVTPIAVNPNAPITAIVPGGGAQIPNPRPMQTFRPGQASAQAPPLTAPEGPAPLAPSAPPAAGTPPEAMWTPKNIAELTKGFIQAGSTPAQATELTRQVMAASPGPPTATSPPEAAPGTARPIATGGTGPSVTVLRSAQSIEQVEAAKKRTELNVEMYGQATPPPGMKNATAAALERKKLQERQDTQLGRPGATSADVSSAQAAADEQARNNTKVYGTPVPPAGQPNATQEDVARKATLGENLDVDTQRKLTMLERANTLTRQLALIPPDTLKDYVGLLRRPRAALANLFADIGTAGAGDTAREDFLVTVSELFTMLGRSDFGSQFTGGEQDLVKNFTTTGTELTSTSFAAKLKGMQAMLAQKLQSTRQNVTQTRGDVKRDLEAGTPKPTPQTTPATAPTEETPEQQTERLRQKYAIPKRTP